MMMQYKPLNNIEMSRIWRIYATTRTLEEFVKNLPALDERDALLIWQAFDYMYDHFNIQEVEEE